MATLKKYRKHAQIGEGLEVVEVEYDFSKDAGATGALDILIFKHTCVLLDAWFKVDTAFTSGGSATLIWGVKGGDTDACMGATAGAVANLTAGAVIVGDAACRQIKLAADAVLSMTIGTAAMTAGKGRFCVLVQKF